MALNGPNGQWTAYRFLLECCFYKDVQRVLPMINAQLMQLVINASNDGIVIAEKEGEDNILIYVNPAFERLTG